jgi:hypothetical protein
VKMLTLAPTSAPTNPVMIAAFIVRSSHDLSRKGTVTLIAMSGIGTPVAYRCSAGSGLRRRWLAR